MGRGEVFHFEGFMLEVAERRLTRGGPVIHLSPNTQDVLVLLLRHAGRLVSCLTAGPMRSSKKAY